MDCNYVIISNFLEHDTYNTLKIDDRNELGCETHEDLVGFSVN